MSTMKAVNNVIVETKFDIKTLVDKVIKLAEAAIAAAPAPWWSYNPKPIEFEFTITKEYLCELYEITYSQATTLVNFMVKDDIAHETRLTVIQSKGRAWSQPAWSIFPPKPPAPLSPWAAAAAQKPVKGEKKRKKPGRHVCQRCLTTIGGKGRHAKSDRGHTKEICDLLMTKMLMDS